MVNSDHMQRLRLRFADMACSIVAFAIVFWSVRALSLPELGESVRSLFPVSLSVVKVQLAAAAHEQSPSWVNLAWICVVATLAMGFTLDYASDLGPMYRRGARQIVLLQFLAAAASFGTVAVVAFALRVTPYSQAFVACYTACLFGLTVGYRLVMKTLVLRRQNGARSPGRRIVVAGTAAGIRQFVSSVASRLEGHDATIAACLLIDGNDEDPAVGMPVLGSIDRLGHLLIHDPIDEVVFVLPSGDTRWLALAIEQCDYFRVGVQIVHECIMSAELRDLTLPNSRHPVPSILLVPEEESFSHRLVWKRLIDVVLSSLALIVLAPLMILIAIAIKVTTPKLPVLYRWNVVGYRGRRFTGYKFTTMVADADDRKADLADLNEMSGPVFKIRNDPRVTPLGKFLRKYSLNELPQFWSVLVGDMSLVGPRPAGPHELVRYETWHKRKLSVRPGITCYWQVRGRNAISNFDDWVKMDLEYIEKRSVWTDFTILFQTVAVVFRGTGS